MQRSCGGPSRHAVAPFPRGSHAHADRGTSSVSRRSPRADPGFSLPPLRLPHAPAPSSAGRTRSHSARAQRRPGSTLRTDPASLRPRAALSPSTLPAAPSATLVPRPPSGSGSAPRPVARAACLRRQNVAPVSLCPFFVDNFCGCFGLRPFCRQKSAFFGPDSGSVLAVDKKRAEVAILSTKRLF